MTWVCGWSGDQCLRLHCHKSGPCEGYEGAPAEYVIGKEEGDKIVIMARQLSQTRRVLDYVVDKIIWYGRDDAHP